MRERSRGPARRSGARGDRNGQGTAHAVRCVATYKHIECLGPNLLLRGEGPILGWLADDDAKWICRSAREGCEPQPVGNSLSDRVDACDDLVVAVDLKWAFVSMEPYAPGIDENR